MWRLMYGRKTIYGTTITNNLVGSFILLHLISSCGAVLSSFIST